MKYYTCANTSAGFVDFTNDNVFDVYNRIKLVCENNYVKSYVLGFLRGESERIISAGSKNLIPKKPQVRCIFLRIENSSFFPLFQFCTGRK